MSHKSVVFHVKIRAQFLFFSHVLQLPNDCSGLHEKIYKNYMNIDHFFALLTVLMCIDFIPKMIFLLFLKKICYIIYIYIFFKWEHIEKN